MKPKPPYLKGKSVFIVSILVIVTTSLTVYFTGIESHRSITANFYWSLSIIGSLLFLFMTYGLYVGLGLQDDYPKFKLFKRGDLLPDIFTPDSTNIDITTDVGDGCEGVVISVLLWIGMTILFFLLFLLLEALFWISIFILLATLYWVFFRALKLVFSKSKETAGDIGVSAMYALSYTILYMGWIFGIVYLVEIVR
ncbi:hypothetical protein [Spongiivirga citrea]|uniref:Uncharacterized protein n=1 Tax=Spongiivirga citrea TaxID=1481457 RepID=A0A6M0CK73_9FLAO|nr:hypothetical protein [Spongiivirga citrea]NER18348.1 hypothetical protein [Spongiivirga citrea]